MPTRPKSFFDGAGKLHLSEHQSVNFWRRVDKTDSCWLWTGGVNNMGYGQFAVNRAMKSAHRVMWLITHGAIPDATPCVLHNCPSGDNPKCVNPAHLWLGTKAENVLDMDTKGRRGVVCGEAAGSSKLTDAEVRHIR